MRLLWICLAAAVASAPPPLDADAHQRARDLTFARGRAIDEMLARGDGQAALPLMSPALRARFQPRGRDEKGAGRAVMAKLSLVMPRGKNKLGPRVDEAVLLAGAGEQVYEVEHDMGSGRHGAVKMIFDEKHQLDGLMVRIREPLPPDPHRDTRAPTTFRLPFDGDGYVYQAGPSALHNASHIFNPDQRHAIDFVVWGEGGTHTRTGGARLEDYWAYGADVLAPCDCLVVSVKDGIDDNRPRVETNPSEPFGNVIVLEAAPSIYVVLGHLLPNSVFVTPGQRVRSGQRIARVGNSGNSTEPHLHMHLQDGTKLKAGDGVPLSFTGIVQNGQLMNEATLLRGDVVHMPVERGPRAVSVP